MPCTQHPAREVSRFFHPNCSHWTLKPITIYAFRNLNLQIAKEGGEVSSLPLLNPRSFT